MLGRLLPTERHPPPPTSICFLLLFCLFSFCFCFFIRKKRLPASWLAGIGDQDSLGSSARLETIMPSDAISLP